MQKVLLKYAFLCWLLLPVAMYAQGPWAPDSAAVKGFRQSGKASFYAGKLKGRKTAAGERYDPKALTAAHRRLPFNTLVRVTNKNNGRSVVVRINDRGPFNKKYIIDLSYAAAREIGITKGKGYAVVIIESVE